MLPFLKKREASISQDVEKKEREPDEGSYDMLGAVAEDILAAVDKKDAKLLKGALEAFSEHLQDIDRKQDQEMKG